MTNQRRRIRDGYAPLMCFLLIDTALLPYIRSLKCTTGMLLLAIWYIFHILVFRRDREFIKFLCCLALICISIMAGIMILPDSIPARYSKSLSVGILNYDLTYSVIVIFTFLYYFFFREAVKRHFALSYKVIKALAVIIFALACVYLISPNLFYSIRPFFTLSGNTTNVTLGSSSVYRYTFSFSDPNNIAAISIVIIIFILENESETMWKKYLYTAMMLVSITVSMSAQGFLSLAIYIAAYFIKNIVLQHKRMKASSIAALAAGILFIAAGWYAIQNQPVIERALSRIGTNSGSAETRLEIWRELIRYKGIFNYILFGNGNAVELDGYAVMPHNGHLYLLYSYGFVFYVLFISIFFWRKKRTKWGDLFFLLPLFICFSINVGLIDARYSMFMAAMTAYGFEHAKRKRGRNELKAQ